MKRWEHRTLRTGERPDDTPPDGWKAVQSGDRGLWRATSLLHQPAHQTEDGRKIPARVLVLWERLLETRASGAKRKRAHPWMPSKLPVPPEQFEAAVLDALQAIRGTRPDPRRCKGEATAALKLWRSLGRPDIRQWVNEVVIVADAARRCPHGLFANDIRGENRADGTDRSRSVLTLCAQGRWEERLRVAQEWRDGVTPDDDDGPPPDDDLPPAVIT